MKYRIPLTFVALALIVALADQPTLALAGSATIGPGRFLSTVGGTVLGTEDPTNGLTVVVDQGFSAGITVASDGETTFQPFNAPFDTSDAIQFNQARLGVAFTLQPGSGAWVVSAADPQTFYLPAIGENEPISESIGTWSDGPNGPGWNPALLAQSPFYIMQAGGGGIDDEIILFNAADGSASLTFISDPLPEPSSIILFGLGIAGLAVAGRLRKKFV